jgi:prepilin-type N-terminal cleavage/methylation domain-containing protein
MNSGGRGREAGGRGQPAVSDVELRTACGERRRTACGERRRTEDRGRRTEDGVSDIKNRRGMTLVEVILAATIMGIMSVVVIHALFYPRFLAVSSTLKQLAVQAATGEIERLRANYSYTNMPASLVTDLSAMFNLNGRSIIATDTVQEFPASATGYTTSYKYKRITVAVSYGTMNVTLITYRSP